MKNMFFGFFIFTIFSNSMSMEPSEQEKERRRIAIAAINKQEIEPIVLKDQACQDILSLRKSYEPSGHDLEYVDTELADRHVVYLQHSPKLEEIEFEVFYKIQAQRRFLVSEEYNLLGDDRKLLAKSLAESEANPPLLDTELPKPKSFFRSAVSFVGTCLGINYFLKASKQKKFFILSALALIGLGVYASQDSDDDEENDQFIHPAN